METIIVFNRQAAVSVLGPYKRAIIWVQGCEIACRGCIVPESWNLTDGEKISVQDLSHWVLSQTDIEGITFSGGEPMLQANTLGKLVDSLQAKVDLGVMCYTGYSFEYLTEKGTVEQKRFLEKIDLLVDGPYIDNLHSDLLWRASSNQRLIPLTSRYIYEIRNRLAQADQSAGIEFFLDQQNVISFAGVPKKENFRQEFEARMRDQGVIIDYEK